MRTSWRLPCSTTSPWLMTAIRSESSSTTARSWADEEAGEPEAMLELEDEIEQPCRHGDVKCACRLVSDQEFRVGNQSSRYGHALTLTAGGLMREAIAPSGRELDALEEIPDSSVQGSPPPRILVELGGSNSGIRLEFSGGSQSCLVGGGVNVPVDGPGVSQTTRTTGGRKPASSGQARPGRGSPLRLPWEARESISPALAEGRTLKAIAVELGRSASTIPRPGRCGATEAGTGTGCPGRPLATVRQARPQAGQARWARLVACVASRASRPHEAG